MTFPQTSGSPHHFLAQLVGGWVGRSLSWPEPEGVPDEAPTQGSFQLILGGRFGLYLYQTSTDGEAQLGLFTFGYNTTLDRWEASWVDSFHNNTAIMFCVGQSLDQGFSVSGSHPDPAGGPDWGWRTELRLLDSEHLVITGYELSPESVESKALEMRLSRVK